MTVPHAAGSKAVRASPLLAVAGGAGVGMLGGMVGLGGAEFRLPLRAAMVIILGVVAGFCIGVVAAIMGVAGG